jgi:YbbR domain-containing protein
MIVEKSEMKKSSITEAIEKIKEAVTSNFLLKVLSIAIAVALWTYVAGEKNVQVGLIVPLELRNLPPGYIATNKIERQVELRVAGPKNLITYLNASETNAFLDLASAKEGKNIYHIAERNFNIPKGINIRGTYPEKIEVILEKHLKKSVPVAVNIKDFNSLKNRISEVVAKPSSVTIEGPEVDLKNIEEVETEPIDLSRLTGEEDIVVPLKVTGRYVRAVGDGMVTVKVKFKQ